MTQKEFRIKTITIAISFLITVLIGVGSAFLINKNRIQKIEKKEENCQKSEKEERRER